MTGSSSMLEVLVTLVLALLVVMLALVLLKVVLKLILIAAVIKLVLEVSQMQRWTEKHLREMSISVTTALRKF